MVLNTNEITPKLIFNWYFALFCVKLVSNSVSFQLWHFILANLKIIFRQNIFSGSALQFHGTGETP